MAQSQNDVNKSWRFLEGRCKALEPEGAAPVAVSAPKAAAAKKAPAKKATPKKK
jgi:hypothetical protein